MNIKVMFLTLLINSNVIAADIPSHCSKYIYKGGGLEKHSAIATWRANVVLDSGDFKGFLDMVGKSDDVWWRYAKDKEYKRGKKWGISYLIVKARPCSAIKE